MVSLYKAIKTKKPHAVFQLIKEYNFKGFYFLEGQYLPPFLITYNHMESLEYILRDNNIDIDYKDVYGNTLLYHATRKGNISCIKSMIDHGANIHIKNNNKLSIIAEPIMSKNYEVIHFIINQGYKPDSLDIELIIRGNHIPLIKYINTENINKELLFFSSYRKNTIILMECLKQDLSLLLIKNKGIRLIDYISTYNKEAYEEIVKILLGIQLYIYMVIQSNIISFVNKKEVNNSNKKVA